MRALPLSPPCHHSTGLRWLRRPSTLLEALPVRLRGGRCPTWQLEEKLYDVTRQIDYFSVITQGVGGDESSARLLRPFRAP